MFVHHLHVLLEYVVKIDHHHVVHINHALLLLLELSLLTEEREQGCVVDESVTKLF